MLSVCIATYNGARFIAQQIESILNQLSAEDEVVICDDGSTDSTLLILERFGDKRLRITRNTERLGHVRNFEKAILISRGELIFLSDQDDIWLPGRVRQMVEALGQSEGTLLVASNFDLIDENGDAVGEFRKLRFTYTSKLLQLGAIFTGVSPYYGCTFLIRRSCLKYCLPVPMGVESHDVWIALAASVFGRVVNLPGPTLQHRIHGSNLTTPRRRAIGVVLWTRLVFLKSLLRRIFEISRSP
jgi:glycosyltransferase involved in cell wall biosynthesis